MLSQKLKVKSTKCVFNENSKAEIPKLKFQIPRLKFQIPKCLSKIKSEER
jgi:hypothetical protein